MNWKCEKCGIAKPFDEIAEVSAPNDTGQCHPFMDLKIICKECYDGKDDSDGNGEAEEDDWVSV